MFTGWLLTFCETGAGALIITWINEILGQSQEQRLIVIGTVETAAYVFNAWVPLYAYNTAEAPHFKYGYRLATMFFALEIVMVVLILLALKAKWKRGTEKEGSSEVDVVDN